MEEYAFVHFAFTSGDTTSIACRNNFELLNTASAHLHFGLENLRVDPSGWFIVTCHVMFFCCVLLCCCVVLCCCVLCCIIVFCCVVVLCCVVVCCIVLFVQLASARGVVHCSMRQRPDPACHSADGVQLSVVNYIIVQPAYSVHCHPVKCSVE